MHSFLGALWGKPAALQNCPLHIELTSLLALPRDRATCYTLHALMLIPWFISLCSSSAFLGLGLDGNRWAVLLLQALFSQPMSSTVLGTYHMFHSIHQALGVPLALMLDNLTASTCSATTLAQATPLSSHALCRIICYRILYAWGVAALFCLQIQLHCTGVQTWLSRLEICDHQCDFSQWWEMCWLSNGTSP